MYNVFYLDTQCVVRNDLRFLQVLILIPNKWRKKKIMKLLNLFQEPSFETPSGALQLTTLTLSLARLATVLAVDFRQKPTLAHLQFLFTLVILRKL